jgi:hypothetical protein
MSPSRSSGKDRLPRRRKPPLTPRRRDQSFVQGVSGPVELAVGRAIIEWTNLEKAIEEVVWRFLRINVDEGRIVTAHLDARHKMLLARQLAERHLQKEDAETFLEVLGQVQDLYDERNLMAHGQWVTLTPDNVPAVMSLREKLPEGVPRQEVIATTMSEERIRAIVDNMVIARNAVIDLRRRLPEPPASPEIRLRQHQPD